MRLVRVVALMCFACCHAKITADRITPTITAIARSKNTVIKATDIPTIVSAGGILPIKRKLDHSKVPITTMNITPISTATGICSINAEPTNIKESRNNAAEIPESRPRPPDFILMILCPTMAQPPMPPKNPVIVFATP